MSLLAALAISLTAGNQTKPPTLDAATIAKLDQTMKAKCDEGDVAGVITLIGTADGVQYFKAFGHRSIEENLPMSKDAIFRIFSMSKPLTAATAMSLWEEGKFKLDDPVSKFLPEWKDVEVGESKADQPMTIRHLMTHSSGLSYIGVEIEPTASLDQFSKALSSNPLAFEPGTDYRYGFSIDILGRLIEAISGKSLDEAKHEHILDPCGMTETDYWIKDESKKIRIAHVHTKPDGKLATNQQTADLFLKPSRMMGGHGMVGTTQDYANFCEMLLNDGRFDEEPVLKKSTVKLMFENHLSDIDRVYGLGGRAEGDGLYNWGGATGTRFWVDRKNGFYLVIMLQRFGYEDTTSSTIQKVVFDALQR